ncbi:MAG: T9SS type A sorting domain-containing protein [Bacteroidales bacterium]|nr:T9SS type A sorting domain-containing protein [Bacteroidales bacterium]
MKKTYISFIFLFFSTFCYAHKIDTTTAKQVALSYMQAKTNLFYQKSKTDIHLVYQAYSSSNTMENFPLFYVFNMDNSGFIIVSADERSRPVLAYSTESTFDINHISPATRSWIESYQNEITHIIEQNLDTPPSFSEEWQILSNPHIVRQENTENTESSQTPLISSKWGQGTRYNTQCPYDTAIGSYCVTGCVVVAMTQVMNYWKHPVRGMGSHSYTYPPYGVLSANFENTTYLYDSMPDALYSSTSANQIYAVANFMYHCGVAIEVQYGVYGSDATLAEYTAGSTSGELALKTYFGYPDVIGLHRSSYNDAQWVNILKNEIDSGRPVIYRGSGDVGGHAFIFDAYNDSDYFHVNWGWNGIADGYFLVSALNPMSYSFPNGHYCLVNIKPTTSLIYPDSNHIVYISPTGAGTKDGSSWENASPNLSFAVQRPYANPTQIWVKKGTYYGDTNLSTAFVVADGNRVYGGFGGSEVADFDLNLRNFTINKSILDGQYKTRVVNTKESNSDKPTLLDGFIIQNGSSSSGGAGVYMNGGTLSNCIIRFNTTDSGYGGGIYVRTKSNIVNCLIHNNQGVFGGGAIIWDSTYFINCTFANNIATTNGGGLYTADTALVTNCIFWNNKRNSINSQLAANSNTLTQVSYSAIQGGYEGLNNINIAETNDGTSALNYIRFVDPNIYDFNLQANSCCVDVGNNNDQHIKTIDLNGLRRIKNGIIDMGSYEYGCYTNTNFNETICMGETYQKNGFNYTPLYQGNVSLVKKIITSLDCDSIVNLHLYVSPKDSTILTDGICLGQNYSAYGFDTTPQHKGYMLLEKQLINQYGCDSVVQLTLYVTNTDSTIIDKTICKGDNYTKNGFYILSDTLDAGLHTFSQLTHNMYGCDSLIILNLHIANKDSTAIKDSVCQGENYTKHGFKINTALLGAGSISRTITLSNQYDCDSVISLNLTILPKSDSLINDSIRKGEIYNKNGFLIHSDTLDVLVWKTQQQLINQYGCDSVVHLHLSISTVGINEAYIGRHIQVFPNPAKEHIHIQQTSNMLYTLEISLMDISGKTILKETINDKQSTIHIAEVAKGMYFLTIKQDQKRIKTLKIIKQ